MVKEEQYKISPLIKARERVRKLKNFYKHLIIYVLINIVLLLLAGKVTFVLLSKDAIGNPDFLEWINWNLYATPIIWGLVLFVHAANVFITSPFKKWEERQIKYYIKKDNPKKLS